ncbi:MAG TPA: agmatine deiminase family protein [Polyangiaceae bacterium]|nr:agmatine deiminase family protein [Polyangiaceae bacterium]
MSTPKKTRDSSNSVQPTPKQSGFRMPAEWEPHAATFLAWPHKRGDWPGKADVIPWVFGEMARELSRVERVRVLVRDAKEQRLGASVFGRAGVELSRIDWLKADTNRSWTRDSLPNFVVQDAVAGTRAKASERRAFRSASASRRVGAVKWRFDGWNRYPDHDLDDAAGIHVAETCASIAWYPEVTIRGRRRRITLEGGSIDVDGQGTLLTTEECLLTGKRARHRALGRAGSEKLLGEYLGISKVIWLSDGIAGDDTSGHIDDFARFVKPRVVVVCREPRRTDPNHQRLAKAAEILRSARDAQNRKLEVIPLPMPEPVTYGGVQLPASYANFYIANGLVLVPTFNDAKDREALGILAEIFDDRRVVGIHARDLVLGLGTLHCSTQQEPAGAPLTTRR